MKEIEVTGAWQKQFDYNYLGTYIVPSEVDKIEVTIKRIVKAVDAKVQGKVKAVTLMYFNEFDKPLILNKENSKILTWNYGVKEVEHWIGRKAFLFVNPEIESFGTKVEGLRFIQNKLRGKFTPAGKAEQKTVLDVTSSNFESLATWLCEKEERTVDAICAKYDVTPEAKKTLDKRKKGEVE